MAKRNVLEMVIAVNIEITTPKPRVKAKPLTAEVPNQNKMIAVMIEEMFESLIESQALENPSCRESWIFLPFFNSSFVLSKIKMFASTAIPMERINPAIPAAVNVTGISLKTARDKTTYITSERLATTPGNLYQRIRNKTISAKPKIPASTPDVLASSPKEAPILCVEINSTGTGSAP